MDGMGSQDSDFWYPGRTKRGATMLNGDRLHQIKLKSWVFTCQHERGPRHYRECLARAAKHSAN